MINTKKVFFITFTKQGRKLASKIIKHDNDFIKTLDRLCKIDSSFPRDQIIINDNYRLERHLAEAIIFGNKAFQVVREKESNNRNKDENQLSCDIYKFFISLNKIELNKILDDRCEKMVNRGLIQEIGELISLKIVNENNYGNHSTPALYSYGVQDGIKMFLEFYDIYDKKDLYLKALNKFGKKADPFYLNLKKNLQKIVWDFLAGFSAKNRQYARRQATWFRNQGEYLWKVNKKDYDIDFVVHDILGIIEKPIDQFNELVNGIENKNLKMQYTEKTSSNSYLPKFQLLKDKKKLNNLVEDAFDIVTKNKENLSKLKALKNEAIKKVDKDDIEDIKKYLI